jgi:hypothetical protein
MRKMLGGVQAMADFRAEQVEYGPENGMFTADFLNGS